MADHLYVEILKAQAGNESVLISLIEKFEPLINKLSYKLQFEDAKADLILEFISLIKKFPKLKGKEDKYIINYVKQSLYHAYILLSKKEGGRKEIILSALGSNFEDGDKNCILDLLQFHEDQYPQLEYQFLCELLTKREANIIVYHFLMGYSIKSIAALYKVTASSISQSKKVALKKLKIYYIDSQM